MDKLNGAVGYLSGAMEFVQDHGVGWRRKFVKMVMEAGLNIDLIDPTNKPGDDEIKIGEDKQYQNQLKKECRWRELKNYVSQYRRFDLRFTDISDFVVAAINPTVPQWGTSNEIYVAEEQHKPIFFICEGGLHNFPNWLFALVKFNEKDEAINIFNNPEDVLERLIQINNGSFPMTDEWVLVRKYIEANRETNRKMQFN